MQRSLRPGGWAWRVAAAGAASFASSTAVSKESDDSASALLNVLLAKIVEAEENTNDAESRQRAVEAQAKQHFEAETRKRQSLWRGQAEQRHELEAVPSWKSWFGFMPRSVLSPDVWKPLTVHERVQLSPNTVRLRFNFPPEHYLDGAGMEVASCLLARAFIGNQKADGTRAAVIRPYTPSEATIGYLELVVKVYPDGKLSKHIGSLQVGDTLEFKGPIRKLPIYQNEFDSIGMVAGGTGITPMLQVAERLLQNDQDDTRIHLIYANQTEEDILLRDKIDELKAEHPDKFTVYYTLDRPPQHWAQGRGFVNPEMIREQMRYGFPKPSMGTMCKVLVCGPPGMCVALCGDPNIAQKKKGGLYLGGHLSSLGYQASQVYTF